MFLLKMEFNHSFLLDLLKIYFISNYACLSVWVYVHACECSTGEYGQQEGSGSPGAGVTGGFEDAERQTSSL